MKLKYTREMISSALEGKLDKVDYITHPIFGLEMPKECLNVPSEVLNPRETWKDKEAYDVKANELALFFKNNFKMFEDNASEEILKGGPIV
jgi:phosphoenolpyruvate carboxykinase (ATP)